MVGRRFGVFTVDAFTLVELLSVVATIGILSLVAAPRMQAGLARAKITAFQAKAHTLSFHYSEFVLESDVWPESVACPPVHVSPGGGLGNNVRFDSPPYDADYYFRCTLAPELNDAFFLDPFTDLHRHRAPFMASGKDELHKCFPFHEGERKGSVVVSRGPDRKIAEIYGPFAYSGMQYDTSNGVFGGGDIFYLMPELSKPRFQSSSF